MVVKSAAKLKNLAPDSITVADPLALGICLEAAGLSGHTNGRVYRNGMSNGSTKTAPATLRVHPVTMWRGRLSVALDALETEAEAERALVERRSPMETTNVQLPTGDRLQIPTGAETLRLKSYLIMCRNTTRDYAEFAELVDSMETHTAAVVLGSMDRYYCGEHPRKQWVATQLVRRLADPQPYDEHDARMSGPDAEADWARVRERCLSVAVAMLEEAR
jgi:RND superfamily putative drug exporter